MTGGGGGGGGGKEEAMAVAVEVRSPFTISQWQELEHQALIYKYMVAGLPVPSDLLLPIQKSLDSVSHRFFHHPTVGYCSFYGKKIDPEPGRCRRTDGKKWRCSKDAHPDSKYCERHMHRGRNRSRKPVESQSMKQSFSTTTVSGNSGMTASFQNLPFRTFGSSTQGTGSGAIQSHLNVESIPYGIPSKDYRYLQGIKSDVGERSVLSEESGSHRVLHQINLPLPNTWPLMQSRVSLYSQSKSSGNSILQDDYPQQSLFNSGFNSGEALKEGQSLRPFFDEWPKTRDSWLALEDERSNQTSFSTTQLSISIPMTSSDFSSSSLSPHGSSVK